MERQIQTKKLFQLIALKKGAGLFGKAFEEESFSFLFFTGSAPSLWSPTPTSTCLALHFFCCRFGVFLSCDGRYVYSEMKLRAPLGKHSVKVKLTNRVTIIPQFGVAPFLTE